MVIILAVILLSGCIIPTEEKYRVKVNGWVNAASVDLIRDWGPPQQIFEMNGHKFLVYTTYDETVIQGDDPVYETKVEDNKVSRTVHRGTPDRIYKHHCKTTFEVFEDRVVGVNFQGNDCSSY